MRFEGSNEQESPPASKLLTELRKSAGTLLLGADRRECNNRMAATPQAAFAVLQFRKNFERDHSVKYEEKEEQNRDSKSTGFNAKVLREGRELTPLKYNSKLMNSIWGLYNRYSVHNFKKIDANETGLLSGYWGPRAEAAEGPTARIIAAGTGAGH